MKHFLSSLALLLLSQIFLTGCTSTPAGRTPIGAVKRGIRAQEAPGSVQIKPEDHRIFVEKLDTLLYTKDFYRGDDLTLRWHIKKSDRGSRALRYLVGFGAGRAEILIEAIIVDSKGKVIGSGIADGDQTMGVMGGSFASAVEEAAEKTAAIATQAVYGR